jgi:signal transduction histidine kinase
VTTLKRFRFSLGGTESIAGRLVRGAALWSLLVLAVTGWGLGALYRQATLKALDADLAIVVESVLAATEIDANGNLKITRIPTDTRFQRPLSGRYWEVGTLHANALEAIPELRSRSLWDEVIPWNPATLDEFAKSPGDTIFVDGIGPEGEPLRLAGRAVKFPDVQDLVIVAAAADRRAADTAASQFTLTVILALIGLAAGLLAAIVIQVRVGLEPLRRMGSDLAAIREGTRDRLDEAAPRELAPLARELNALIDHNKEVVERARTHVGNLAHALKTPISVLMNAAREPEHVEGASTLHVLVTEQTDTMTRQVEHYLQRAAAAARAEMLGARTAVDPVANEIVRTLKKLYGPQGVTLTLKCESGLVFRGERHDFEELLGNIAENACKYGGGTVTIDIAPTETGWMEIYIQDDGDGLSKNQMAAVLKRGARLDESAPGAGLGLSICVELAKAYGGALNLEPSDLGGLGVRLRLPSASS